MFAGAVNSRRTKIASHDFAEQYSIKFRKIGELMMGMNLKRPSGEEFHFTGTGWFFILNLAEMYGWKPAGTKKPKGIGFFVKWHKKYDSNEGQFVTASDAIELSVAIEKALSDPDYIENSSALAKNIKESLQRQINGDIEIELDIDLNSIQDYYSEFIRFCKKGEFSIE